MVSFAALIVETHDALALNNIGQSIFVHMLRRPNRDGYSPDDRFDERAIGEGVTESGKECCLHVGNYANKGGHQQELVRGAALVLAVGVEPRQKTGNVTNCPGDIK